MSKFGKSTATVTRLIQNIGKIRDMLEDKDYKKISECRHVITDTQDSIRRNYKKFLIDGNHPLDFNSYDLTEVVDEIVLCLEDISKKVEFNTMVGRLRELGEAEYTREHCDYFAARALLTELHSVLCYIAVPLRLLEEGGAKRV